VFAQQVGVALQGAGLDLVVGQPGVLDVGAERLAAAAGIAQIALGDLRLGPLPGAVGVAPLAERPGGAEPALEVPVDGRVTHSPVAAHPLTGKSHVASINNFLTSGCHQGAPPATGIRRYLPTLIDTLTCGYANNRL
jgi:hypothetical protein